MTVGEFKDWVRITESSRGAWVKDDLFWHNRKEAFFYTGGVDGKYVSVDRDGKLQIGTYEGAYPHIGEAIFTPTFSKKFDSQEDALKRLIEVGGAVFPSGISQRIVRR